MVARSRKLAAAAAAACFVVVACAAAPAHASSDADLAAARALFERNLAAIQRRDREGYLACYRADSSLARVAHDGVRLGFEGLAGGTPASGSTDWPDTLIARDLRLAWIGEGIVFGSYRYRVVVKGAARDGISCRLFVRDPGGWRIAVTSAYDAPPGVHAPPLALVGATLYDGRGGAPVRDAVVIVRDGRIARAGARATTPVPDGVDVVDLSGRFIVPGLVDTHVHYSQTGWADGRPDAVDVRAQHPYERAMAENRMHPERYHRAFLSCGVTAVFDVGGYPWTRTLSEATERSPDAPHVGAAGALLATRDPEALRLADERQMVLMEDEAGVRSAVRSHAAQGSKAIKIWLIAADAAEARRHAPLVMAAGAEARAAGLPLIVHATTLATARVAVEAGARLLVHSVEDSLVDEAFMRSLRASGAFYCPTLTVHGGYLQLYRARLSGETRDALAWVDRTVRDKVLETERLAPSLDAERGAAAERRQAERRRVMARNLARLHRAGVPVVLGTDAGNPLTLHGPSVFPELEAMQAAGMLPLAVLSAATRDAAAAMGRGQDLGVIEAGRIADLVVLDRDPARDIANLRRITHVMRAGLLHPRAMLAP